jgi:ubiquinone biosynthesis monooxygenase Coq7
MNDPDSLAARRIIKVNHAGEFGAIRIYRAQIFVARFLFRDMKPFLSRTLRHEINHCEKFREAMIFRGVRPCRTMWVWSRGGYILGFVTALMGRNMIMVCTEAVEDAVHRHMNEQIDFLKNRDDDLGKIIEGIQAEELEHLHYARERVKHNGFTRAISRFIGGAVEVLIWLSTQGSVSRMRQDLRRF